MGKPPGATGGMPPGRSGCDAPAAGHCAPGQGCPGQFGVGQAWAGQPAPGQPAPFQPGPFQPGPGMAALGMATPGQGGPGHCGPAHGATGQFGPGQPAAGPGGGVVAVRIQAVPHSIQRCQASETSRSADSAATSLCHRVIQSSARPSSSARVSAPGGGAAVLPPRAPAASAVPGVAFPDAASRGPAAMAGPSVAAASGVHPGAAPAPVSGCGCDRAVFSGSAMRLLWCCTPCVQTPCWVPGARVPLRVPYAQARRHPA
jgi:hypothetical protein